MMYGFLRYGAWTDRIFYFGPIFALLPHEQPKKSKFKKNEKNNRRYHHFTHFTQVYHKWKSYDVWFLRYGARQTEFFIILGHFLPFYPTNPKKSKFWKNEKNIWRYHHFTAVHQRSWSYAILFLRYGTWQTEGQTDRWTEKVTYRGGCPT